MLLAMEDCYFSHASLKPLGKMRRDSEGEPEAGNKRQHRDERKAVRIVTKTSPSTRGMFSAHRLAKRTENTKKQQNNNRV